MIKLLEAELHDVKGIKRASFSFPFKTRLEEFKENYNGCSLLEIRYIGDEKNNDYIDWATRHNKSEVIVFISNFKVGPNARDGVLNPNSEYDGYSWILVRNENENWIYVDGGYG